MAEFPALTHVALTVRDLAVSVPWYEAILGAKPVLDEDTDPDFHHTVYLLGNGTLLGLHQHGTPAPDETFSEHRIGLDHVSFGCADRSELERWQQRLGRDVRQWATRGRACARPLLARPQQRGCNGTTVPVDGVAGGLRWQAIASRSTGSRGG